MPIDQGFIEAFIKDVCIENSLPIPTISFKGKRRNFCYWEKDRLIYVYHNCVCAGIVAHELAHYLESRLKKNRRHNDELLIRISGLLDRIISEIQKRAIY